MHPSSLRSKVLRTCSLLLFVCGMLPSVGFAQGRDTLLVAAPLLHGSAAEIDPTDVGVFISMQKLIGYLNVSAGQKYLYPNPQMGTPNEIGVWALNRDVDVSLLTYPMYAAIQAVGFGDDFKPIASISASDSVILGNASACQSGQTLEKDIPQGLFITRNEYSPNGRLLAEVLFAQMGVQPMTRYSGENLNLAVHRFVAEGSSATPTFFLLNTIDSAAVLARVAGSCVLRKDIQTPWPATVVAVRKDLSADKARLLQAGLNKLNVSRDTLFPQIFGVGPTSLLGEQIGHFTQLNGPNDPVLVAAAQTLQKSKVDLRAFFNLSELMLRLADWTKEGVVSLSLTSADSRTAYALGAVSQVMLALQQNKDVASRVFLQGTSGGAMGVLVFALDPQFGLHTQDQIRQVLDPNTLLNPAIRFKLFVWLVNWRYLVIIFLILMLAILFHSPIILWKQVMPVRQQLKWFGSALLFIGLMFVLCPSIPLEWGALIIVVTFALMVILRISKGHIEVGPRTYILGVFILAIIGVTTRSFIYRDSLLDSLNTEGNIRTLAQMNPDLHSCAVLTDPDAFATCLFGHIQYPFVVSTSDISSNQQVFFYAEPEGTDLIHPPRIGKWVNIETCPGKFLRVIAGSASFPFVFPPSTFTCAGVSYKLLDGAIFSSGTTNVATALGASTVVTFLNEPFTAQDILKTSTQQVSENSLLDFMASIMRIIFGFNYYHDFQQNLSDIRQVTYAPPANAFILPNFQYFGVMKDGVNYTADKIFEIGKQDVLRQDGLFIQLTSNRFAFDSFADELDAKQILVNTASSTSAGATSFTRK